jgi:hypothetical protein
MNSHGNVVCGMECFPPSKLKASWLSNGEYSSKANNKQTEKHWVNGFTQKNYIEAIGDKFPRAYFNYKHVIDELSEGVVFINIRNISEVFCSFDSRANNKEDSWRAGMIWFFAYIEFLHLLAISSSHASNNVYFVNYNYLMGLDTRKEAAEQIFRLIDVDMSDGVKSFLEKSELRTRSSIEMSRPTNDLHNKILSLNHYIEIEKLFAPVTIVQTSLLADQINRVSDMALVDIEQNIEIYEEVISSLCKDNKDFINVWNETMLPIYMKSFESKHLTKLVSIVNECLLVTGLAESE